MKKKLKKYQFAGENFCGDGTTWDDTLKKCVPNTPIKPSGIDPQLFPIINNRSGATNTGLHGASTDINGKVIPGNIIPIQRNTDSTVDKQFVRPNAGSYDKRGTFIPYEKVIPDALDKGFNLDSDGKYRKTEITTDPNRLEYSGGFKALNTALDLTRFIAGNINNYKVKADEQKRLEKARYQTPKYNSYENGLNNIPVYFEKGGSTQPRAKNDKELASRILAQGELMGRKLTAKQVKHFKAVAAGKIPMHGHVADAKKAGTYQEGGALTPYSQEKWDNLEADYNNYYDNIFPKPPLRIPKDDGYDSYYYDHALKDNPVQNNYATGWLKINIKNNTEAGVVDGDKNDKPEDTKKFKFTWVDNHPVGSEVVVGDDARIARQLVENKSKNNKPLYIRQEGGYVNNTGYLEGYDTAKNPYNIIPSGDLTMDGVPHDVMAYPNNGKPKLMKAGGGRYSFPNADFVVEVPHYQNGGKPCYECGGEHTMMQIGGDVSVVNYLANHGQDYDYNSRKQLAQDIGIKNYKGTVAQNMQMLQYLKANPVSDIQEENHPRPQQPQKQFFPSKGNSKDVAALTNVVTNRQNTNVKPQVQQKQAVKPVTVQSNDYQGFENDRQMYFAKKAAMANNGRFVLTDKATNRTFYGTYDPKADKFDVNGFEVLTGKNKNSDIDPKVSLDQMEQLASQGKNIDPYKVTPVGFYPLTPQANIYGAPGLNIGNSGTAYHITYQGPDDMTRAKRYGNKNKADNYTTYGCVNCQKPSIEHLTQFVGNNPINALIMNSAKSYKENANTIRTNTPDNKLNIPFQQGGGLQMVDDTPEEIAAYDEYLKHNRVNQGNFLLELPDYELSFILSNYYYNKNKKILHPTDNIDKPLIDITPNYVNNPQSSTYIPKPFNFQKGGILKSLQPNIPFQQGGNVQEVEGGAEDANAELEQGEVFQTQQGQIQKVAESEPTHEDGGSDQADVHRVLEDTGDKRNDVDSKLLKIKPAEAEAIIGFKPKTSVTHSKLYEQATEFYDKKLRNFEKKLATNLEYVKNGGGKVAQTSLEENLKLLKQFPTKQQLFDTIYNHQEAVKQKYRIDQEPNPEMQTGGTIDYIKKKAKKVDKQPSGSKQVAEDMNNTYYGIPGSSDYAVVPKTNYGARTKQNPTDYITSLVDYSWEDLINNKIVANDPKYKAIYDQARAAKYPNSSDTFDYSYVPKNMKITVNNNESVNGMPTNDDGTNTGLNYKKPTATSPSKFNEPLRWYDVAGNVMNYLSSLEPEPVPLEQLQRTPIRVHELNPLPTLLQNQGDYNAALQTLPTNGVGYANQANLLANKYKVNNEVLGQYENINKGKYDAADQYNDQSQYQNDTFNLLLRDQFTGRVAQRNEVQRQSKLNPLDDLFTKIAQNRKLNREGNLIMQLYPYFNQFGEFNGNQYDITPNGFGSYNITDKKTGKVSKVISKQQYDAMHQLKGTTETQIKTQ